MYGSVDIAETMNRFPTDILNARQNEMIQSLKGKSGKLELTSSETSSSNTMFNIKYVYEGQESSAKHLLDLINTIYVVSK
jgi:archaellum component FlaF (FlaF/FlaG flagellin family)